MLKVKNHLESFDEDLCENGFGISQRRTIGTAALLTYCSVLRFPFQGRLLPRGWLDILIMGDTACGKSEIVENLVKRLKLGEFIKGENTSFAGLIGGLQQVGSRAKWDVVWGRMPLNHGRLLVVDEMSGLSVDDISNMSGIRSSGIAEIVKVTGGITRAATRMIWIGNPRSDNKMGCYSHGILAVKELIGRPEDIRRFDFCIGVSDSDVPEEITNKKRDLSGYRGKFDELRHLIKWVWQLRPQEVVISEETSDAILALAIGQAKNYSASIPIVEPNEQRIKIARVAVATAARCLSEQGGKLIVLKKHAEYADDFMRQCYDSRALGYNRYSLALKLAQKRDHERISEVKALINQYDPENGKIRVLMECERLTIPDIEGIFDIPRAESRQLLSTMLQCGIITRKKDNYAKTTLGVEVLEEMLDEKVCPR